ncbi:cytochrome P450 [Streptomyces silvisoli]|uniref:Cytochrome P450 n=1 Tax=Streptomyces silvisoli TaxID=3034235 RepID=A0ABT5ZV29_9ACTN|nr:cytochrome P450 [Streptomyces silvisoli]MDF3293684.1 cytochrome P450 [Streptomyces silvisoli]
MHLPDTARWALTHGLIRLVMRREAARDNPATRRVTDPRVRANPYPHYETLRTDEPFVGGLASKVTVRHDVATEVLRVATMGAATFGGAPGLIRRILAASGTGAARGVFEPPSMVAVDPPYHSRYRKLVTRAFTAKAVTALRERTEQVAVELLDKLTELDVQQPVDLVRHYASQLPTVVICEILGAPTDMRDQFLIWSDAAASHLDPGMSRQQFLAAQKDIDALLDWLRGHFAELRRNPGQDILSDLVNSTDTDGQKLTEVELLATAMLVLAAGLETTVNLIGNGIALLEQYPDQRALLAERPELWPNAVDEMLRVESPVQRISRRALQDTEIAGVALREGEIVVVMLGAANRDPLVFTEPARFDVTRANAGKHLAFSSGIHYCLGAALAKMEGEVGLRALYQRFPDLTLLDEGDRKPTRNLRGFDRLTASLTPAPVR